MTIWFTSDHHFGHKRIIELAKRPFISVEEMDEHMIVMWNRYIEKNDIVYHLGDFAFTDHTPYLEQLNGRKRLLKGNHDHSNRVKAAKGWEIIYPPYHEIKEVDGPGIVLCHYAMRVWNKSGHGAIHLYGHSHGNLVGDSQSCDVGVDAWDFMPATLDMIKTRLKFLQDRTEPDHHAKVPRWETGCVPGV